MSFSSQAHVVNHQLVLPVIIHCTLQHLHLQEFGILKEHKLQGATISVVPFFFTMGVDVSQTITDLVNVHNVAIEKHINQFCYRDLVCYANSLLESSKQPTPHVAFYNAPENRAGHTINLQKLVHFIMTNYDCDREMTQELICDNGDFSEQLSVGVDGEVDSRTCGACCGRMRSRAWTSSRASCVGAEKKWHVGVGEQLHTGIVVMCKSGKDRTGMLITLREAKILESSNIISKCSVEGYLDLIRQYGTRIMNTEKNTGKAQYMFNPIQNTFLPKQFKAPKCTRGHGIT